MHIILKCLSLSKMNHRHKVEVWQWLLFIHHHSWGVLFHLWSWGNVVNNDTFFQFLIHSYRLDWENQGNRVWICCHEYPRSSLARYLIPLPLNQLFALLGAGIINYKTLLNMLRLSEFRIDKSRFFDSITVPGKKRIFVKTLSDMKKR